MSIYSAKESRPVAFPMSLTGVVFIAPVMMSISGGDDNDSIGKLLRGSEK